MIFYTHNLLGVLAFLLAGTLELYLFATVLRLVYRCIGYDQSSDLARLLREFTDTIPIFVQQRLSRWRHRPTPMWLPWCVVIVGVLVVRQTLLMMLPTY